MLEACFLAAGVFAVGYLAFDQSPAGPDTSPALLSTLDPFLCSIWAAPPFGLGGTDASTLIITTLAIWGTMQGEGPFLTQTPHGKRIGAAVVSPDGDPSTDVARSRDR